MDRAVVIFAQTRQFARVIQVRVAQDDGVHLPRVEGHDFIEQFRFLAMALEQSAFEQKFFAVDLDEIHGAGGGARRAKEMDFHARDLTTPRRAEASSEGGMDAEADGKKGVDFRRQSDRFPAPYEV